MSALPEECAVAFKEWAGVCRALIEGRQTLIVRKGGISEGPGGFAPEHRVFWLYPTQVHQAQQGLRDDARAAPQAGPADPLVIEALAVVELVRRIDTAEELLALTPFHVWTLETMRKRFAYREPGLWVLGVRVFRAAPAWTLQPTPEQLGCKSWVVLDAPFSTRGCRPVIDENTSQQRLRLLQSCLSLEDPRGNGSS